MITIRLFGSPSLVKGAQRISGPATQRHRLALLALLVGHSPRALSRERAAALLWPDRAPARSRNLLNQAVHALRRSLGEEALASAGDDLCLAPALVDCDVLEFERALETGRLEDAVDLATAPFLEGFVLPDAATFDQWLEGVRERLRRELAEALETLATDAAASGAAGKAAAWWQRRAAMDPHNARVTLRLMEALARAGDRAGALRHARLHTLLVEEEFGVEPAPEVAALADRLRESPPSMARDAPPPPAPSDAPTAAPASGLSNGAGERAVATMRAGVRRGRSRSIAWAVGAAAVLVAVVMAARPPAAAEPVRRIAVLPLENRTGGAADDNLVAYLHEDLIGSLARVGEWDVISRRSVMRFADAEADIPVIARELDVDAVITGSVRLGRGDTLELAIDLVRGAPEAVLVRRTSERPYRDRLLLAPDVAHGVASHFGVPSRQSVEATPPSPDREAAIALVTEARSLLESHVFDVAMPLDERERRIRGAIDRYERAVLLDPNWADAWAGLANSRHWLASGWQGRYADSFYPQAKQAAETAIRLDSANASAWASLGFVQAMYDRDFVAAEASGKRAVTLERRSDIHWLYALVLRTQGKWNAALAQYAQAEMLSPNQFYLKAQIAATYACAGDAAGARAQLTSLGARMAQNGLTIDSVTVYWSLGRLAAFEGDWATATTALTRALALADAQAPEVRSMSTHLIASALAYVRAASGDREQAQRVFARVDPRAWTAAQHANLSFALGDTTRALDEIAELYRTYPSTRNILKHCVTYVGQLRSLPAFHALIEALEREAEPPLAGQ